MRRQQWGLYAIALAILVVGLVWVGFPASTLLVAALVLACPLMMFIMMRDGHGGHAHGQPPQQHDGNRRDADRQDIYR
jgi:type III secretory pathway component EscV